MMKKHVLITGGSGFVGSHLCDELLKRGVYVIAFSYPVVPQGKARIRTQMSAAHTPDDIDRAIAAFVEVRKNII